MISKQFIKYSVIGISGATLDLLVFLLLFNVGGMAAIAANLISTSCGITNNFFLNRHYNFRKKDFVLLRFLAFYGVGIVGILLSTFIIRIFHDYAGWDANIVKAASVIVVVLVQYGLNKRISFRDITSKQRGSVVVIGQFLRTHLLELSTFALAIGLLIAAIPHGMLGTDEADNFLSAKLMLHGSLPYVDFFSHHMPGAYIISMLLYVLGDGDMLGFRIALTGFSASFMALNFWLLHKYGNRYAACAYLILLATAHMVLLGYMALAETFIISIASTVIIMLLLLPKNSWKQFGVVSALSLLLFFIPFSGISYSYFAALLYLMAIPLLWEKSWKRLAIKAAILASPYILMGAVLVGIHGVNEFIFQNFTFNAEYYSPFFGDMGSNGIQVLLNVLITSIKQLNTIVTQPGAHLLQLLLVLGYVSLPLVLWARKQHWFAALTLLSLLIINPRVGIFGLPGIESSFAESVSQHAAIYRAMALVYASLAIALLSDKRVQLWTKRYAVQGAISLFLIAFMVAIPVNALAISHKKTKSPPKNPPTLTEDQTLAKNPWTAHKALPSNPVRIINSLTNSQDTVWIGPIDFIDQPFLIAQRATNYTFYLPWHSACSECRSEFTRQLQDQKPLIIMWSDSYSVPNVPTPDYGTEIRAILSKEYYQIPTDNPDFANLYFRKDQEQLINERLRYTHNELYR